MKTRILIVAIILLFLSAGGYWFFVLKPKSEGSHIAKWIPANSLALVTVDNLKKTIDDYSVYEWWDEAKTLPFINALVNANSKLDSLISKDVLHSKVNENPVYVSLHITSNSGVEPLVFVKSEGFEWLPTNIKKLASMWMGKEEMLFKSRVFSEQLIYEADEPGMKWGFITVGDFLVVSTNSVLLEDVIRTEGGSEFRLFKEGEDVQVVEGIGFSLNTSRLNRIETVFKSKPAGVYAKSMSGLVSFKLSPNDKGIVFNGVGVVASESVPANAEIRVENFIPSSATSIRWFGLDDAKAQIPEFNIAEFLKAQNFELCQIQMDLGGDAQTTVLLNEVENPLEVLGQLENLSTKSRNAGDTLFVETYLGQEIRFINRASFFSEAYGEKFKDLNKPYYAIYNNVLLMSDRIDGLKAVLSDYDAENTWGRVPEKRRYLDNLIREANITQLNNFEYFLDPLVNSFNPKWKEFFKNHESFFSALDNFNYQVNASSDKVIVSASLTFNESAGGRIKPNRPKVEAVDALELKSNGYADAKIVTKPFVVKNHNNGDQEVIFQDENSQVYLLDKSGNILWKKQLDSKITGPIEQIDFYDNRKLQFVLFTESKLYVIDRNGDDVENFPVDLGAELPMVSYTVVDYDKSKNYRYAAADRRGNVYLFDKGGEALEGWNPKVLGSGLMAAPEHVRIRGRDCFIMVQSNGVIHLTNRRGEEYPGFPYNYNKRLTGDFFIRQGPSFEDSFVKLLSEDGEAISVDFNGKVKGRNQILKPSTTSKFYAAKDKLSTGLMLVRQDGDRFTFFDETGKKRFEKQLSSSGTWNFEYYNFRNDSELFVVQSLTSGDLVILDEKGNEKVNRSAFTSNSVALVYYQSKKEYELFANFDNQSAIFTFAK